MDKKLRLKLNGGRGVVGVLRGFDQFLNLAGRVLTTSTRRL
jgi:small nuclear ribonucleoprotein G